MELLSQFISFIKEFWYKKYIPIIILIAPFILSIFFFNFNMSSAYKYKTITIFIIGMGAEILWVFTNKIPENRKNKVGILVAISTENEEQHECIKSKIVDRFRDLINSGKTMEVFEVLHLPRRYDNIISNDNIINIMKKTNSRICIYGRCIIGNINSSENYLFELNGAIRHIELTKEIQNKFAAEFSELFIREVTVPRENDLLIFKAYTEHLELVCKYILGITAYLSGEIKFSLDLYTDVLNYLHTITSNQGIINKLKNILPNRFFEIHYIYANYEYLNYRKSNDEKYLFHMKDQLDCMNKNIPNSYQYFLLLAIYYFYNGRQIRKAKECILKCRILYPKLPEWRFSDAFLYAYDGELMKSYRKYQTASKHQTENQLYLQIENFIYDVAKIETDNANLYFALTLINHFFKKDDLLAQGDLMKFIELSGTSNTAEIDLLKKIIFLKYTTNNNQDETALQSAATL